MSPEFIQKLVDLLNKKVDIPILNERQEEMLLHFLLELLVASLPALFQKVTSIDQY